MKILGLDILGLKTSLKNTVIIRVLILPCINLVREEERERRMYQQLGVYISAIYTLILLKHGKKLTQILIRHICKTKDTHIPACTMFVKRLTGRVAILLYVWFHRMLPAVVRIHQLLSCSQFVHICSRMGATVCREKKIVSRS